MMDRFAVIRAKAHEVLCSFEALTKTSAFDEQSGAHSKLDAIADACFQLSVIEDEYLPAGVLGALDLDINSISYRPGLLDGRRIYTVAHELGHRALEHPDRRRTDTEDDINESPDFDGLTVSNGVIRNYDSRDTYELEANVFAAELLAPSSLVHQRMLDNADWTVEGMCEYFGLSRLAMLNQITAALRKTPKPVVEERSAAVELKPDPKHDEAVNVEAPALVMAGPGAGKTRILVRRYQRLVAEGCEPRRILALTFSNKAAAEMRERLTKALPEYAHEIAVFTFHSFGLEILRGYGGDGQVEPKLLNPAELFMALRSHLSDMPMGSFESLSSPARDLGILLNAISKAKDELVDPDQFAALADSWLERLERNETSPEKELELARRTQDAARFYKAYENVLQSLGALDYGDLISKTVRIIRDTPAGAQIRDLYDHILVDEFQDINHASGMMVKALAGPTKKVWAVGDIRQSIYRFRGASPANLARFQADYHGAKIVTLDRNYRSVEDVVVCGQAVVIPLRAEAQALPHIALKSDRGRPTGKAAVDFVKAPDSLSETSYIVERVAQEKARVGAESVAVLCRTRSIAQRLSDALESNGITTTWPGDLESSRVFKDVLAMLYLAVGDLRGFVRLCDSSDFALSRQDLQSVLKWAKTETNSARYLLYEATDGKIEGLSEEGQLTLSRLKAALGKIAAQPTPFHALTTYLFEFSRWCRALILDERPAARRSLTTVRQICSIAKSFKITRPTSRERIEEFIEYIETCTAAGKLEAVQPEIQEPDCVTVMTVHGSKGLEWPVVVVPCLAKSKFPIKAPFDATPIPEKLIANYDPADDLAEEACLFYVAMTRARDSLVLTYAEKYGRKAEPSEYLEPVLLKLDEGGFLNRYTASIKVETQTPTQMPGAEFKFENPIRFSALRKLDTCSRQFEYAHILGLYGGDHGYRDFHRAVGETSQQLLATFAAGESTTMEQALECLEATWKERGPVGHYFEKRFKDRAELLVEMLHARLCSGETIELSKVVEIQSGSRSIEVIVDEIEHGEVMKLKKVHFGRPATSHAGDDKDHMPALLASVAEQLFPGKAFEVKIRYPLLGLEMDSKATPRIVGLRLKKMATLADQGESGIYPTKPGKFSCGLCAYQLVCGNSSNEDEA